MVEVELLKPDYIRPGTVVGSVHVVSPEDADLLERNGAARRVVAKPKATAKKDAEK